MTAPPLVILTGCGRSGTTVLGKLLARHPDVTVLNDQFDLWVRPFPFADVWGKTPQPVAEPRIALGADDAARAGPGARDQFLAGFEARRNGRRVLVEKLAINNFRLPFLHALAPDAPFINIVRHGVEVARSIAARAAARKWYGADDRKWSALVRHAESRGLGVVAAACATGFDRGLLEWRLSVEAAERFFASHPSARALHVRYEDLVSDPLSVAAATLPFLGLPPSPRVDHFALRRIARRTAPADEGETPPSAAAIAGDALDRFGYPLATQAARGAAP